MLAVAWNLVREALRHRSAALFFLLVAASGLALPLNLEGDGTPLGRLQLAVVYGMGVPCFLITVATVVISAGALSRELELRTIQLVAAKPVPRWRIVAGKLLGVCFLDLGLLTTVLLTFAVNFWVLETRRERSPSKDDSAARVPADRVPADGTPAGSEPVEQRFLSPRLGVFPETPLVNEERLRAEVDRRFRSAAAEPRPPSRTQIEANLRRALRTKRAAPGESVEMIFRGLERFKSTRSRPTRFNPEVAAGSTIFLRYELLAIAPEPLPQVAARWEIIPPEAGSLPDRSLGPHAVEERKTQGVAHEFSFPASYVSPQGDLRVRVENKEPPDSGVTLFVDLAKVELLVVEGRFWPNVARALLLVLSALILLSSIALAAGALFTFPTANLLGLFVYFSGLAAGFLREVLGRRLGEDAAGSLKSLLERCVAWVGRAVLDVLPDFTSFDPLGHLARGRTVTVMELAGGAAWMVCIEAGGLLLIAMVCFSRRELARGERY